MFFIIKLACWVGVARRMSLKEKIDLVWPNFSMLSGNLFTGTYIHTYIPGVDLGLKKGGGTTNHSNEICMLKIFMTYLILTSILTTKRL